MMQFYPNTQLLQVVFQINDICDCQCKYCYEINKTNTLMTQETAKRCIDFLFKRYSKNQNILGFLFEFIGGEPLLNYKIIDFIGDYFIEQCIKHDSIWLTHWIGYYISNGNLYFNSEIQKFIYKWKNFIFPSISLDGPKEIHNLNRLDSNNIGNFDKAYAAFQDINKHKNMFMKNSTDTKIVISHNNIKSLFKIIKFFANEDIDIIAIQPNLDEKWENKDFLIFYYQLKQSIDYIISNNKNLKFNLLSLDTAQPLKNTDELYCDFNKIIAFDTFGNIVPCNRFFKSSLNTNQSQYIIGNVYDNSFNENDPIFNLKRKDIVDKKCLSCKIAFRCITCLGCGYKNTNLLQCNTDYCGFQKVIHLINFYYWNKYKNIYYPLQLQKQEILEFIPEKEYISLINFIL